MKRNSKRLIVCGGGMAGLTAAITVAELGIEVIVIEKGPRVGGTLVLSGGMIWTFARYEEARRAIPYANEELQSLVFERIDGESDWLVTQGIGLAPKSELYDHGIGRLMLESPATTADTLQRKLVALGGQVSLGAALHSLLTKEGKVVGVTAVGDNGAFELDAAGVVLATGGFQGNPELLCRYMGVGAADRLLLRSNPWSTGDAFIAATQIGAAITSGLDTFYGHALIAPPGKIKGDHTGFRDSSQLYGQQAVALNLDGVRFADESAGTGEEYLNQQLAKQREGRGFYVVDDEIMAKPAIKGRMLTRVVIERAVTREAVVLQAATLTDLCDQMGTHGVPPKAALHSLEAFNESMISGDHQNVMPPRLRNRRALSAPPYWAVSVKAGITFTMGGLAVDGAMRVLNRSASNSPLAHFIVDASEYRPVPIPGLYAAGCDVGNVSHGGYMGGISAALVTGRVAGRTAAADMQASA